MNARLASFVLALTAVAAPATVDANPRPLPVVTLEERAPIPFRPFTIQDVRRARPELATARPDTPVQLRGRSLPARELLDLVNRVERAYNRLGYSLRDRTPRDRRVVRVFSPLRMHPVADVQVEPATPTSDVAFTTFPAKSWSIEVGDRSWVQFRLANSTALANTALELRQQQAMQAGVYLFDDYLSLASASATGVVTNALDGCREQAVTTLSGTAAATRTCAESGGAAAVTAPQEASASVSRSYTQPIWGPLEVTIKGTIGTVGKVNSAATGTRSTANGDVSMSAEVVLGLRITGGIYLVSAGVAAELVLAKYSIAQRSWTTAAKTPSATAWQQTAITWNHTYQRAFESGNGALSFVLVFDLLFDEIEVEWTIVQWDGASSTLAEPAVEARGTRPAVCTSAGVAAGAMCSGKCVSLLTDLDNCGACGNRCTAGSNPSCSSGTCKYCRPTCVQVEPGGPDGCGGKCPPCPQTKPYFCEPLMTCMQSQRVCSTMSQKLRVAP